jgi:hypothetical protein
MGAGTGQLDSDSQRPMKNLIALLLFLGGASAWKMWYDHQNHLEGLSAAQEQAAALDKSLQGTRAEVKAYAQIAQLRGQITLAENAVNSLRQQQLQAEQNLQITQSQTLQSLAQARQKFAGQVLQGLQLQDGRKLGNVRLIKLEENNISVATVGGVVKFAPAQLPEPLRRQFFYQK